MKRKEITMSKDELVSGFEEYTNPEEVTEAAEEGEDTPNSSPVCSAIGSAILTNNFNC